jgi:hypothetical protein
MKAILNGILCVLLFCGPSALADVAGERAFSQAVERFEHLHMLLREMAEQGGIEEDSPVARDIGKLYEALKEELEGALEARSDFIGPDIQAEIEERYSHFNELLDEVGDRLGAVRPELLDEVAERFWHAMKPLGEALGVHRGHEAGPGHFDVTARLEFSIEGVGEPVAIVTVVPHYRVEVRWGEQTSGVSVKMHNRRFEAEGELHPVGERWLLHCQGEYGVSSSRTNEGGEEQTTTDTEMIFNASALLRPGQTSLLVGNGGRKLRVALWLDD